MGKKKNILFITKIFGFLIGLLLIFILWYMFKSEILNNYSENKKEYFKLLITVFFNLLLPFFLIIQIHIQNIFPALSFLVEFFCLFLEGSLTNNLAENNLNNSDLLSEADKNSTVPESEPAPKWEDTIILAANQTDSNTNSNSLANNNSGNSSKKTLQEEEDEEYKYLYEKGPEPKKWSKGGDITNSKNKNGNIGLNPGNLESNNNFDPYSDSDSETSFGYSLDKLNSKTKTETNPSNFTKNNYEPNNSTTLLRDLLNKNTTNDTVFPDTPVGRLAHKLREEINKKYYPEYCYMSPEEYKKTILNICDKLKIKYHPLNGTNENISKFARDAIKESLKSGDHSAIFKLLNNNFDDKTYKAYKSWEYFNRFTKN